MGDQPILTEDVCCCCYECDRWWCNCCTRDEQGICYICRSESRIRIPRTLELAGNLIFKKEPLAKKWVVIRLFFVVYAICIFLGNMYHRLVKAEKSGPQWIRVGHEWVLIINVLYFLMSLKLTLQLKGHYNDQYAKLDVRTIHNIAPRGLSELGLRLSAFITRALLNIGLAPIITAAIYFWVFEFDRTGAEYILNFIHVHGIMVLLVLADFFMSLHRLYYASLLYAFVVPILYIFFTWIYWHETDQHRIIYKKLDWSKHDEFSFELWYSALVLVACNLFIHFLLIVIKNRVLVYWCRKQREAGAFKFFPSIEEPLEDEYDSRAGGITNNSHRRRGRNKMDAYSYRTSEVDSLTDGAGGRNSRMSSAQDAFDKL